MRANESHGDGRTHGLRGLAVEIGYGALQGTGNTRHIVSGHLRGAGLPSPNLETRCLESLGEVFATQPLRFTDVMDARGNERHS